MMARLPWSALLTKAAEIGIGPADFWEVSLKEWRLIMQGSGSTPAMGRGELEAMLAKHPDGGSDG
jgi:hypothetical protein